MGILGYLLELRRSALRKCPPSFPSVPQPQLCVLVLHLLRRLHGDTRARQIQVLHAHLRPPVLHSLDGLLHVSLTGYLIISTLLI